MSRAQFAVYIMLAARLWLRLPKCLEAQCVPFRNASRTIRRNMRRRAECSFADTEVNEPRKYADGTIFKWRRVGDQRWMLVRIVRSARGPQ